MTQHTEQEELREWAHSTQAGEQEASSEWAVVDMSGLLDSVSHALISVGKACKLAGAVAQCRGSEPEREPDETELMILREISAAVQQPYEAALHEVHLRTIHEAFHGASEPFAAVSENWRTVGFQGNDPITDLRGAGSLGLKQLAYFVTHYPDRSVAVRMRRLNSTSRSRSPEHAYPWGAVGINVTRAVCELFQILSPYGAPGGFASAREGYWAVLRDENFVDELYCAMFEYVDTQHEARGLGYMDFPMLLEEAKNTVRTELTRSCNSHSVSIHRPGGYYASRLPLESVRLGLGLPPVLGASQSVAKMQMQESELV